MRGAFNDRNIEEGIEPEHHETLPPADRESLRSRVQRSWTGWATLRTRIIVESVLLFLAVLLVVAWFAAPYVVRDYINRGLSGLPDYTGRVEWVRLHPLTASVDVYDFHVDKKGQEIPVHFFYSPRWNVSLQWSQIFHGTERASVLIFDPRINLVAGPDSDQSQIE